MLNDSNFLLIRIILTTHTLNSTLITSEILQFIDNQLPCLVLQKKKKRFGNSLVVQWLCSWPLLCAAVGLAKNDLVAIFKTWSR